MADAFAIQENFEVVGSDGDPVGLVDHLDGGEIKLKRKDGESGGRHHWISVGLLDKVEAQNMRVLLKVTGDEAQSGWREDADA
jgi:hypothetical protein